MKKILLFILIFICLKSFGQYPVNTSHGNSSTLDYQLGSTGGMIGFVFKGTFGDTTAANLSFIKNVPGQVIRIGDSLWMRNNAATKWNNIWFADGGSVGGFFSPNQTSTGSTSHNANDKDFEIIKLKSLHEKIGQGINYMDMYSDSTVHSMVINKGSENYGWEANANAVNKFMKLFSDNGSASNFIILYGDSTSAQQRISYSSNIHGSLTPYSLIDRAWLDSLLAGFIPSVPGIDDVLAVGQSLSSDGTINLNSNNLFITNGNTYFGNQIVWRDGTGQTVGKLNSFFNGVNNFGAFEIDNTGNGFNIQLTADAISSNKQQIFQDKSGTIALLSDIADSIAAHGGGISSLASVGGGLDIQSGGAGNINTLNSSDFNLSSNLISIDYTNGQAASASTKGFLTSADWNTFNNKQDALVSGTNIKTINGTSILGPGNISTATSPTFEDVLTNGNFITLDNGIELSGANFYIEGGQVAIGTASFGGSEKLVVAGSVSVTTTLHVADDAYNASTWNGNNDVPTKNAIRDKIESLSGASISIGSPVTSATVKGVFYGGTGGIFEQSSSQFTFDSTNARLGIDVASPALKLDVHNIANTSANLTGIVSNNAIGISNNYTVGGNWNPGIIGYTPDDNSTIPKWGIWAEITGSGTMLHFGVSNNYAIAPSKFTTLDYKGGLNIGSTSAADSMLKVNGSLNVTTHARVQQMDSTSSPVNMVYQDVEGTLRKAAVPSSGANPLGTYIVQTSTNAPANAQILASLSTGILKVTTTTGVLSTAVAGDFPTLNQNTTGTANISGGTVGAIPYQSGANATTILAATATANKMLLSGASAAPTWSTSTIPTSAGATANKVLLSDGTNYILSTPTFPNASATSGKIIKSDGTNWLASTETYAAPGTSGNIFTSDGTNWTSAANTGGWTVLRVSGSNFTTTSATLVDITGLVTGTLSTATLYEFECVLYVNSSSTAGLEVGVQQSGTGSGQIGVFSGTATNAAATGIAIGSNALNTASAACVLVNGDGQVTIKGFIKTGSTGTPTISMKTLKLTSGTTTVYIGSVLRYRIAQ